MATALKLKNDTKKLKAAISSKATPKTFIPKLKTQLEKVEVELKKVKESGKPTKPTASTSSSTMTTLEKLKKLIKSNPKFSDYKGSKVDLQKDAGEGAFAKGKRASKGLKANQFGTAKENKGKTYYEYRVNRLDVKQPRKKQTYPKLEAGGSLNKKFIEFDGLKVGDTIRLRKKGNRLDLTNAKILDISNNSVGFKNLDYPDAARSSHTKYTLSKYNIELVDRESGKDMMASGGYMAKGGQIGNFRVVPMKRIQVAGSPDLLEPYYSLAFTVNGSLSEANEKAQNFVKNNENIISATVTKIHPSGQPLKNKKVSYVTKDEIQKYASGGYMADGGELHRAEEGKYAQGGMMFKESEFKDALDEGLSHLYGGLNGLIEAAMGYLDKTGQGGMKKAFAEKIGLDGLKNSIEKIDEYLTK